MIQQQEIRDFVEQQLVGTPYFLVGVTVTPTNDITVTIDSAESVDIDECVKLTRAIEEAFDRDAEDYQLEVGSAGLTAPFTVKQQYVKNIGNTVEVLTRDGRKMRGTLTEVGPEADDFAFTIEVPTKVKPEGAKRPVIEMQPVVLHPSDCKTVTYYIDFK